jgi:hypothetical protein
MTREMWRANGEWYLAQASLDQCKANLACARDAGDVCKSLRFQADVDAAEQRGKDALAAIERVWPGDVEGGKRRVWGWMKRLKGERARLSK